MNSKRVALPVLSRPNATSTPDPHAAGVRIGLVTLGCDKNTVDSERIMARLASSGAHVQSGAHHADVVVINTCGFIDQAKEESIEAIFDAVRLKKQGSIKAVVAMGCLVQRYKDELQMEMPDVDAFLTLTETDQLVPFLRREGLLGDHTTPLMERPLRLMSTSTPHTSYLKISEGCDHTCAFCAIPLMRGKHKSTPMDVLIKEAQELEQRGVKELNIISQDTTWYGRDLKRGAWEHGSMGAWDSTDYFIGKPFARMKGMPAPEAAPATRDPRPAPESVPATATTPAPALEDLLIELTRQTTIPWFRLFYMYPSGISRDLVDLIASQPRILPYLDMPLQHGSDHILKLMRRPERKATIRERVSWLRDAVPDLALRTTLIVGFPGETEDDFAQLMDLVEEIRFDYIGAFTYSPEEDTLAATLANPVPDSLKRERLEQLLDMQRTITLEKNEARVGSIQPAIIDRLIRRGALARTKGQALEVDGVVQIADARGAKVGDFVNVKITGATEHDLRAEIVTAD